MTNLAPVGVFDSGIGGLTVAHEMIRQLPHESLIYFGDTARVPYGPKSPDTVRRYSREIAGFLREQRRDDSGRCADHTVRAERAADDATDQPGDRERPDGSIRRRGARHQTSRWPA